MAIAFFVCGLQLVFLTTHLPTYLAICGMDPTVGSTALALIGLFNVLGSYLFGWLGGRYSKRVLLGGIYVLRSVFITAYFLLPPSPTSTLVFAAAMGTLWLGVVPLVSGLVVHLFGLRYMATLSGIAFFSHQVGSFFGAWGGGLIYSALGSYELAWQAAVAIGVARRHVPDDDERAPRRRAWPPNVARTCGRSPNRPRLRPGRIFPSVELQLEPRRSCRTLRIVPGFFAQSSSGVEPTVPGTYPGEAFAHVGHLQCAVGVGIDLGDNIPGLCRLERPLQPSSRLQSPARPTRRPWASRDRTEPAAQRSPQWLSPALT